MPLELMNPGERGEIMEVTHGGGCGEGGHSHGPRLERKHDRATGTRAEEMGLRVGKMVEVLQNDGHLLLLLVDEARIAIDRKLARGIRVKGVAA